MGMMGPVVRPTRRRATRRQVLASALTNLLGCGLFVGLWWVLSHRVPWS